MIDEESCYRALQSRDARFDGRFFTGVTSTGIYCRPSCPAPAPRRAHVVFFPSAAAAQSAGFRACKRCRPQLSPDSPEWNARADLVGRAMRLIRDGYVEREGVAGLASHLGYSARQLHRQLSAELGAGPLALARSQRAESARLLLEASNLPIASVCFAAGFASIRQFNETIRAIYASTPAQLRAESRRRPACAASTTLLLRLAYRPPNEPRTLFDHLAARALPGVERRVGGGFARVLDLPHRSGVITLAPGALGGPPQVSARLELGDLRDLTAAVGRCRHLLDLDADPEAVDDVVGKDPLLAALVASEPGRRVPGCADPNEFAVRALLAQRLGQRSARLHAGRLASGFGGSVASADPLLSRSFPRVEVLAGLPPSELALPDGTDAALLRLCAALASGEVSLDPGADREEVARGLRALGCLTSATIEYIKMGALADPDAFPESDPALRRGLGALGLPLDRLALLRRAEGWRPWRSYATQHLLADPASPAALSSRRREGAPSLRRNSHRDRAGGATKSALHTAASGERAERAMGRAPR